MERTKMPRIKRAAQFAPFDALKGLHDALERKRKEHINSIKQQKETSTNVQLKNDIKNTINQDHIEEEN